MRHLVTTLCIALLLAGAARRAAAEDPDPKRRVAVLEFRSGSVELAEIDERIAALLSKLTSLDVVDAVTARKVYGAQLDRDLVSCEGGPRCVARIGKKLDAVEVLMVGVSEFGDVILTLQRIETRTGAVASRIAEALEPGSDPSQEALSKYLERVMPRSDFLRYGMIRIRSNVAGAAVTIDSKPRGLTPVEPLKVRAPASYEIRVSKPGYITFSARVLVPPDGNIDVRTDLTTRTGGAWYSRWWVAAIAGTVVVGAATGAVLILRDDPLDVPVTIRF
jgi:hypothetical protein